MSVVVILVSVPMYCLPAECVDEHCHNQRMHLHLQLFIVSKQKYKGERFMSLRTQGTPSSPTSPGSRSVWQLLLEVKDPVSSSLVEVTVHTMPLRVSGRSVSALT